MPDDDDLQLLSVVQVALLLKRSKAFVRSIIRAGKLAVVALDDPPADPGRKGRRDYRCTRAAVAAFIDGRTRFLATPAPPMPDRVIIPKRSKPLRRLASRGCGMASIARRAGRGPDPGARIHLALDHHWRSRAFPFTRSSHDPPMGDCRPA